jgi:predicted lipoprotein with Yx(FWY)xxD motif
MRRTTKMAQTKFHRKTQQRFRLGRVASVALAVGGLSGSVVATAGATSGLTVATAKNAKLGTILVSGKTLYTLKASKVSCTAACIKIWPELLLSKGVKKATAGNGVSASKLGTVARAGGVLQVTYGGKPLYYFSGDKAAGQVKGTLSDTWGSWSTVVTVKPTSSSSGSGSGGNTGTGGVAF